MDKIRTDCILLMTTDISHVCRLADQPIIIIYLTVHGRQTNSTGLITLITPKNYRDIVECIASPTG